MLETYRRYGYRLIEIAEYLGERLGSLDSGDLTVLESHLRLLLSL